MADQPTSPNSDRIGSMLQDLAAAKAMPTPSPAPMPVAPMRPTMPTTPVPANLPIQSIPVRPAAAPLPTPAPVAPAPMPRPVPPPPPPREIPTPVAPPAPRPPAAPIVVPTPIAPPANPGQYTSEMRTMSADIGRISTGQQPVGMKPTPPPAPASPIRPIAPVAPAPAIVIPDTSRSSGMGSKIVYGILGIAVVGILIWIASQLFGSSPTAQVTPTPTASPAPTLIVSGKSLTTYFPEAADSLGGQPQKGQALRITAPDGSIFPVSVSSNFTGGLTAVSYGQTEQFDTTGKIVTSGTPGQRFMLLAEVSDVTKANQAVSAWEVGGMATQLQATLRYTASAASGTTFATGTYKNISVRYMNFPYADSSVDWAIVPASNNKNYLVIAGSRESMFFAIDQLLK